MPTASPSCGRLDFLVVPCRNESPASTCSRPSWVSPSSVATLCTFSARPSQVLAATVARARREHPALRVCGAHDGYWAPPESDGVVEEVRAARPDILFVGMPSPRKEYWLAENLEALGVPFSMGVGGSFDVYAGAVKRAPSGCSASAWSGPIASRKSLVGCGDATWSAMSRSLAWYSRRGAPNPGRPARGGRLETALCRRGAAELHEGRAGDRRGRRAGMLAAGPSVRFEMRARAHRPALRRADERRLLPGARPAATRTSTSGSAPARTRSRRRAS